MAQARPASVTVMAVLNLVLGSLMVLVCLYGSITNLAQSANAKQGAVGRDDQFEVQLDREVARAVPGYRAYQVSTSLLGLLLSVALLLSGIGLLNLRRWGRSLALVWAVLMILMEIGTTTFHLLVLSPAMGEALRHVHVPARPGMPDPAALGSLIMTVANVAVVVIAVLLIVYAVILFLMMMKQNVRAAFAGLPAPGGVEPVRLAPEPYGAEQPPRVGEGPAPEGGGEQGIRRNPWDY